MHIFHNLFLAFLVKQLFLLCLGWRILFIFLFDITFSKRLVMAPLYIVRFMGPRILEIELDWTHSLLVHLTLIWFMGQIHS